MIPNKAGTAFISDIRLDYLNVMGLIANRSLIITKKPKMQGRIRVKIGNKYSRSG